MTQNIFFLIFNCCCLHRSPDFSNRGITTLVCTTENSKSYIQVTQSCPKCILRVKCIQISTSLQSLFRKSIFPLNCVYDFFIVVRYANFQRVEKKLKMAARCKDFCSEFPSTLGPRGWGRLSRNCWVKMGYPLEKLPACHRGCGAGAIKPAVPVNSPVESVAS